MPGTPAEPPQAVTGLRGGQFCNAWRAGTAFVGLYRIHRQFVAGFYMSWSFFRINYVRLKKLYPYTPPCIILVCDERVSAGGISTLCNCGNKLLYNKAHTTPNFAKIQTRSLFTADRNQCSQWSVSPADKRHTRRFRDAAILPSPLRFLWKSALFEGWSYPAHQKPR